MIVDIKKTVKQTAVYSLGNLSSKLIGFILLPLYTDYLTVSEYGILAILDATSQILIGVFGFNIHTAMLRWAAEEKHEHKQKSIIFTSFVSTFVIIITLNILLLPLSSQFSLLFFESEKFSNYFIYLFLASGMGILNNISFNLIRLREKSTFYIVLNTFKFGLILLLNIYFIVYKNMGVEGIILSQLLGHLAAIFVSLPFVSKNINLQFDTTVFKEMFRYSFPLIFSTTSVLALSLGDRYILKFLQNETSVGIYSLGNKVASVINVFIIQSFQLGFLPIAFKKLHDQNAKRFFSKMLTYFTFLLVITGLFLSMFAKETILLLTKDIAYEKAYYIIPFLCFGFILKGLQNQLLLGFHFTKQTIYHATIIISASILNVYLNFILIPKYDYFGATIAMIVTNLFIVLITYYFAQKVYFIPYEIIRILKLILLALAIWLITQIADNDLGLLIIILKLALFLSFPFLLILMRFYEDSELIRIKESIYKWKRWRDFLNNLKSL